MADYQRQRVYNWEANFVAPRDSSRVRCEDAQNLVNYIWAEFGLKYPPIVSPIAKNCKRWAGQANRTMIELQPIVSTKTIIHECAHSMTMDLDDNSCGHGPTFVGMYAKILDWARIISIPEILYTCQKAGVDINIMAQPVFKD